MTDEQRAWMFYSAADRVDALFGDIEQSGVYEDAGDIWMDRHIAQFCPQLYLED